MNTGSKGSSRHGIGLDGCSGEELADVCTDVCVEADGDGEADVCADGYSQVGQVGQVGQRRKQQFIVFFLKTLRSAAAAVSAATVCSVFFENTTFSNIEWQRTPV